MSEQKEHKYSVACDFDGVIHSYTSGWGGAHVCADPPVEGAIEWLNEISQDFTLVILTTRGDQPGGNEAVLAYLEQHGYSGPPPLVTSKKVPALVYVDDRAWRFEGPGTFPTTQQVHQAHPWNKRPAPPEPTHVPPTAPPPEPNRPLPPDFEERGG